MSTSAGPGSPASGDAWGIALADPDGQAASFDLQEIQPADETALAAWLADPAAPKIVHASKEAWHALAGRGLPIAGVVLDTELAAYLCQPDRRAYDLTDLAIGYLHRELGADEVSSSGQGALDLELDGTDEGRRAAVRAAAVRDLADVLSGELSDRGATGLLENLELPLVDVLARMERTGIAIDSGYLSGLEKSFDGQVQNAAAEAYAVIGREVNLGSPKQLQEVLFDQLGMPKTKKIKTGYTTDAAALTDLFARTQHPFLEHLLAHRDAIRLRQTVEGLLRSIAPDGRIHTTFQQTIAATGRLSSADPNLQNIPIRTEAGRQIRRAFVVGDGYETLLTADYSQIEMRIMAHLSGDEGLIDAFRSGEDLHSYVGSRVFGVPTDEVTPGHAVQDQGHELRPGVRAVVVRALAAALDRGVRGRGADAGLLLAVRRGARLPHGRRRRRPADRVHRHDPGAPPVPARPDQRQPPAPRDGRADGAERADPGQRRRPDQGGDARASTAS